MPFSPAVQRLLTPTRFHLPILLLMSFAVAPLPAQTGKLWVRETAEKTRQVTANVSLAGRSGGRVVFFDGLVPIGTATIDADGNASLELRTLSPGPHTLKAIVWGTGGSIGEPVRVRIPVSTAGTFRAPDFYISGTPPAVAVSGDVDGDGVPDLILAGPEAISILRGAPGGRFAAPALSAGTPEPAGMVLGDFNGDGRMDVAIADVRSGVGILLGQVDGTLSAPRFFAAGKRPSDLSIADFNGDGIPDLAVVNQDSNDISILIGAGDGSFTRSSTVSVGLWPRAILAADLNGDGIADLATANFGSNDISVLIGDGKGSFQPAASLPAGNGPARLWSADFNEDGIPDLLVLDQISNGATLLLSSGRSSFLPGIAIPNLTPVGAGDLNGDGHADALFRSGTTLLIQPGRGDGSFSDGYSASIGSAPQSVVLSDFDGDGRLDVATADAGGSLAVLLGAEAPATPAASAAAPFAGPSLATASVSNTNDSGAGSLRDAINNANDGDTVSLSGLPANSTITLSSAVTISKVITVDGGSGHGISISGNNQTRIFIVQSSATIQNLTLKNGLAKGGNGATAYGGGGGAAGMGGAVFVVSGNPTFRNVTFSSNKALGGNGGSYGDGGASAAGGGGGLGGDGGGPVSFGIALLTTLNEDGGGSGGGGGPLGGSGGNGGYLTISAQTYTLLLSYYDKAHLLPGAALSGITMPGDGGTGAGGGGGGYAMGVGGNGGYGGGGGAAFYTIASGIPTVQGGTSVFGGGRGGGIDTLGAGFGGDGYGGAVFVYAGTPLFDNCTFNSNAAVGGSNGTGFEGYVLSSPTSTSAGAAIYVKSTASAQYTSTAPPVFSGNSSAQDSDVSGPMALLGGSATQNVAFQPGDTGFGTLRWAVAQAASGNTVVFANALFNGTITLASEIAVTKNLTIDGMAQNVTISGNNTTRIFFVNGGSVTIQNLKLSSGLAKGGDGGLGTYGGGGGAGLGGAILLNAGTLSVTNVTFSGNKAQGGNGGTGALGPNVGGGGGGGNAGSGVSTLSLTVPTAYAGGQGGSGGDFGNSGGPGGQINQSLTVAAITGQNGSDGAGGGGGTGGGYPYNGNVLIVGGNGGNGGFAAGGGGGGGEICQVSIGAQTCTIGVANSVAGGNGGFGGGGGAGAVPGSAGLFGGVGGTDQDNGAGLTGGGGAGLGGAIFQRAGTLTISSCSFQNNSAAAGSGNQRGQAKAGAVFYFGGVITWVTASTFSGNSATDAGLNGIDNGDVYGTTVNGAPTTITINSSTFSNPSTPDFSSVVAAAPAGSTITFDSTMTNAMAPIASEIIISKNLIIDGTIGGAHNVTLKSVGLNPPRLFCITGGIVLIKNIKLTNGGGAGSCSAINGGAVYVMGGDLTVSNLTFDSNAAGSNGGAIYNSSGGALHVFSSRFFNSSAVLTGAAIASAGVFTYGGGNTFSQNSTQYGHTVDGAYTNVPAMVRTVTTNSMWGPGSLTDAVYTSGIGSTILFILTNTTLTLTENLYIGSDLTIDGGSGITLSGGGTNRIITVEKDTINPANTGNVNLSNLSLLSGYAKGGNGGNSDGGPGGGAAGMGGAIYTDGVTLTLTNVTVKNNQAVGGDGGQNTFNIQNTVDVSVGGGGGGSPEMTGGLGNDPNPGPGGSWFYLLGLFGGPGGEGTPGSAGAFGAGGGGGGNNFGTSSFPGGNGGDGSFGGGGGGGGSTSLGTHEGAGGTGGTFGGNGSLGEGGGGAGLGGGVFVRSGNLQLNNVNFGDPQGAPGNNAAHRGNNTLCATSASCAQGSTQGQGQGGAIFLNSGATETTLGPVLIAGNSADNGGDTYGTIQVPSSLVLSHPVKSAPVGTQFGALQVQAFDALGHAMAGLTILFQVGHSCPTCSSNGSGIAGPQVFTAVTDSTGTATAVVTANSIQGTYTIVPSLPGGNLQATTFILTNQPPNAVQTLSIVGGSPQSTAVGTVFATQLQVKALDISGNAVPYTQVQFYAPQASFPGPSSSAVVTTDVKGLATAPTLTANLTTGTYNVQASDGARVNLPLTNTVGPPASITTTAGTPQSTAAGSPFGTALQAQVKDAAGNPISNVAVTFTSGPGATFANNATAAIVQTDGSGYATAPTLTATQAVGGPYYVLAGVSGVSTPASFALTNNQRVTQTITVTTAAPAASAYSSTFNVAATSSSGLAVAITAAGVCSVQSGGSSSATIQMTSGTGTCNVKYDQAGNSTYGSATEVTNSVTAQLAIQATLTVSGPGSITYGTPGTAAASGGSGTGGVTFSAGTSTGCSVTNMTVSVIDPTGTCLITATKAADTNYSSTTSASFPVTLTKANQATLTVTGPGSVTYGATGTATATGGSGAGTVSFSVGTSTGCSISGNVVSVIDATGTCSITATKAADNDYNLGTSSSFPVTLNKAAQATLTVTTPGSVTYGTPVAASATGGTGSGAVTFSAGASTGCSVITGMVSVTDAAGTCSITAIKAADDNYSSTTSMSFPVMLNKATPVALTITGPASVTYGNTAPATTSGGGGTGAITVTAGSSTGCSVTSNVVSATNAIGTCSLTAVQAADNNYSASSTGTAFPVTLNKANQATLAVTGPVSLTYGSPAAPASASGGSGTGTLSFSAGGSTGCSVSANAVGVTNASGTCTLTASQTGDNNYNPATSAPFPVLLNKANQATLTVIAPGSLTYGTTGTAAATGGSGTGGFTFSAGTSTGCAVSVTTVSVSNASGNCSLTATKAADDNYNSATSNAFPVTLSKAGQATLTMTGPGSVTYGTPGTAAASGGSGSGALTFSAGTSTGCSVSGTVVSVTNAAGSCALTAMRASDSNYNSITSASFPVTLTKASVTITANPQTKPYLAALPALTFQSSGFPQGSGPDPTVSCSTLATALSPVGKYAITCSGQSTTNYSVSYFPADLTITALPLAATVSFNPVNPQYSDPVTISVSLPNAGGVPPATGIVFSVAGYGPLTVHLTLNPSHTAYMGSVTSPALLVAPAVYPVAATFAGADTNYVLSTSPSVLSLTVAPEDARAYTIGASQVSTSSANATSGMITLSATIKDPTALSGDPLYDPNPGDIRNATVTFVNRKASNATLCTAPVGLVDPSGTTVGAATCQVSVPAGSYTVGIVVGGSYLDNNTAEDFMVNVAQPGAGWITGSGTLALNKSAGLKAADTNSSTTFAVDSKFVGNGSLVSDLTVSFTRTESGRPHNYQITLTSSTSFWATSTQASLNGLATITDTTSNMVIDTGTPLQFTVTGGKSTTVAITLFDKSGGIWFSTNWNGTDPVAQTLSGGGLTIH